MKPKYIAPYTPLSLFRNNEQGVWYDPSDFNRYMGEKGPELVTNGTFDTDTNWIKGTGWTISGGVATANITTGQLNQIVGIQKSTNYEVSITVVSYTSGGFIVSTGGYINTPTISAIGTYKYVINSGPNADTTLYVFTGGGSFVGSIDNISVREVTGVSTATLFQDSAGTTPVTAVEQPVGLMLDKRLGLVRGPEKLVNGTFDSDTNWIKGTGWTILGGTANAIAATSPFYQTGVSLSVGKYYEVTYTVTLTTGNIFVVAGSASGTTRTVSGTYTQWIIPSSSSNQVEFWGTGMTGSIDNVSVKEIQGNHARQSTSTSRPVLKQDANGKYYLYTDGIDDFMVTNAIDFTGTDKMTVIAGMRAIGTATGVAIELSNNTSNNNGAFGMYIPDSGAIYTYSVRGTAVTGALATLTAPPITKVFTGISSISSPVCTLRADGVQVATSTASQGTGNYGNYPLYLFRRAGTSFAFNGQFYGLIIRGAQSTDKQIIQSEKYEAKKTGITI